MEPMVTMSLNEYRVLEEKAKEWSSIQVEINGECRILSHRDAIFCLSEEIKRLNARDTRSYWKRLFDAVRGK